MKKVAGRGGRRKEVAGRGGRRKKVTGHGARRKKVAGCGGRRKKVTGKGGRHEEGVGRWSPIYLEVEVAGGKSVKGGGDLDHWIYANFVVFRDLNSP
uniref:Uncharacterized protein n=1 Tax=Tanacetum cinerariifolium TaxID=118510 RepID=A0A699H680_TANCI|nr:hypothetical protein [Tanacetum cinerariifolium]